MVELPLLAVTSGRGPLDARRTSDAALSAAALHVLQARNSRCAGLTQLCHELARTSHDSEQPTLHLHHPRHAPSHFHHHHHRTDSGGPSYYQPAPAPPFFPAYRVPGAGGAGGFQKAVRTTPTSCDNSALQGGPAGFLAIAEEPSDSRPPSQRNLVDSIVSLADSARQRSLRPLSSRPADRSERQ